MNVPRFTGQQLAIMAVGTLIAAALAVVAVFADAQKSDCIAFIDQRTRRTVVECPVLADTAPYWWIGVVVVVVFTGLALLATRRDER